MPIEKISFNGLEKRPQIKNIQSFQGKQDYKDNSENKEMSDNAKLMIGATAIAGVIVLSIAGYKGHLGKGIQKFLGGAEKTAGKESGELTPHGKLKPYNSPNPKNPDINTNSNPHPNNDNGNPQIPQDTSKKPPVEQESPLVETSETPEIVEEIQPEIIKPINNEVHTEIIEETPVEVIKPTTKADEQAEINRQLEEYRMEIFRKEREIAQSNDRNTQWLKKQHEIKEKEYSDFWNQDVIKADDITPEVFIQTIKNIESGKTVRIMTDEGTIKSYTALKDGSILFERGNENGKIVEQYKIVFTDKEKNIAKHIKQNKDGEEKVIFVRYIDNGIKEFVNLSVTEERAVSEYASRIRNGLNSRVFNAHKRLLLNYGFVEVDKTVKIGNETVHIVLEGLEHDVTEEGKLLKKVFAKNGQVNYKDVTTERINEANERYLQEEARRVARQKQQNKQKRLLFA